MLSHDVCCCDVPVGDTSGRISVYIIDTWSRASQTSTVRGLSDFILVFSAIYHPIAQDAF